MKRFNIEYFTACDESLYINFDNGPRLPMQGCGNGQWSIEADAELGATYSYELCSACGDVVRCEEFGVHTVTAACDAEIFDHWLEIPKNKPFYSTLFTEGVFRRESCSEEPKVKENQIVLSVDAPTLRPNEMLAIVGAAAELGQWRVDNALVMNDSNAPTWSIALPACVKGSEYKFVILDSSTKALVQFETGDNRRLPDCAANCVVINGLQLSDGRREWRGAGVAIPLFSLRSDADWGCGDFSTLAQFGRWAQNVGMSVIQFLITLFRRLLCIQCMSMQRTLRRFVGSL